MKDPVYESSIGALEALLETDNFVMADLYTYTTLLGTVMRFTTADIDVSYSGNTWSAGFPLHAGVESQPHGHWKSGLDVDTWQYRVSPRRENPINGASWPDTVGGKPWVTAARSGVFDGTTVVVDRAYFPNWGLSQPNWRQRGAAPTGVITMFAGRVAAVDIDSTGIIFSVNDFRELFNEMMPRNMHQTGCRWTLYDSGCTLDENSFKVNGTVGASSTRSKIFTTIAAPGGSATYKQGMLKMTSGANNGFRRLVRDWSAGSYIEVIAPFPYDVTPGDTFSAYAGCDRSMAACTLFANAVNFGGEPYIPAPETAL